MRLSLPESKLTLNDTATAVMKNDQYNSFTFNLKATAKIRHDQMEGRDYLVVPCVMMTAGVHEGSQGPLYYPADEMMKTPEVWNYKPVVVYHPQLNGQGISACDPVVITKQKIGVLMGTRFEDGEWKTECWLEEDKANEVDDRVLAAIENGDMMEVSTGLFTDNEMEEGEWNGKKYIGIARNLRPDHLAILPDLTGACSIEDGAGLLRNVAKLKGAEALLANHLALQFNELSHNEIWKALNATINSPGNDMNTWVSDVFDDFFLYEKGSKIYYQKYSVSADDVVKLEGIRMEAEKQIQYVLSDGTIVGNEKTKAGKPKVLKNKFTGNKKENDMDKEKIVDGLIANAKLPWTEEDRDTLMALNDGQLEWMVTNSEEKAPPEENQPEGTPPAGAPETPETPAETPEGEKPTANEDVTVDQFIDNAPEGLRGMLKAGLDSFREEKDALIKKITANKRNKFTPEYLQNRELDELKALVHLAWVPESKPEPASVYFGGLGEAQPVGNQAEEEEPLVAPVMNFEEK